MKSSLPVFELSRGAAPQCTATRLPPSPLKLSLVYQSVICRAWALQVGVGIVNHIFIYIFPSFGSRWQTQVTPRLVFMFPTPKSISSQLPGFSTSCAVASVHRYRSLLVCERGEANTPPFPQSIHASSQSVKKGVEPTQYCISGVLAPHK